MSDSLNALANFITERGSVTPTDVVEAARPAESAFHDLFDWDDSHAAEQYRKAQARGWIRKIKATITTTGGSTVRVRAFVSAQRADESRVYMPTETAMSDEMLWASVTEDVRRDLHTIVRKLRAFEELGGDWAARVSTIEAWLQSDVA